MTGAAGAAVLGAAGRGGTTVGLGGTAVGAAGGEPGATGRTGTPLDGDVTPMLLVGAAAPVGDGSAMLC